VAAFSVFGNSRVEAGLAMKNGNPPRITWKLYSDPTFYAEYEHLTKCIYLNEDFVARFEKTPENQAARQFVKATVLHEMVHHLDFLDGSFQDYDLVGVKKIPKEGVEERGHAFERMAFGRTLSGSW
jgi:hypothetical protein